MSSSGNLPAFPTDVLSVSLITLSLQKLVDGNAEECRRLFKACTDLGFFYLDLSSAVKGSILLKDVDNLFELASDLSHLSSREKEACRSTHDIFGYKSHSSNDPAGNRTELFNISANDLATQNPLRFAPHLLSKTESRTSLTRFATSAREVTELLITRLEELLQLPPQTFSKLHADDAPSGDHVSITITPPDDRQDLRKAFNAHTDHGSVTLLFHKILGGLQVLPPKSDAGNDIPRWSYVKPQEGCAIVNLGDCMHQLSGGLLRACVHRVVAAPGPQANHMRYSIVYFTYPTDDAPLKSVMDQQHVDAVREGRSVQEKREVEPESNDGSPQNVDEQVSLTCEDFIARRLGSKHYEHSAQSRLPDFGGGAAHGGVKEPGVFGMKQRDLIMLEASQ